MLRFCSPITAIPPGARFLGTWRGECIIGFFRVIIDFIEEKCKMIGAFRRDNQDFWLNHVFCG